MECLTLRENAERLNLECLCRAVAETDLTACLDRRRGLSGFGQMVLESRPHLFSRTPVFVTKDDADLMAELVRAIERVGRLPAWIAQALAGAPQAAQPDFGVRSVFMGYDFHIGAEGPRLIEINTNAGGAYLNQALLEVAEACCDESSASLLRFPRPERLDETFIEIFQNEHRLQKGDMPLSSLAIVDDDPSNQYLLPEFELAKVALEKVGIKAFIADPAELAWQDGRLWCQGTALDLVYNRLVDFSLDEPGHKALREAYMAGAVVVTPSPRTHALLADKRHLALLSDAQALREMGADFADGEIIARHVPKTVLVSPENAGELWASRKRWFFKPGSGHAGKAAYRGDKITKRAWEDVLAGASYVAQEVAPPSERGVMVDGVAARMKSDIRLYTYDGKLLLMAARLYQGQTTNFRTEGGGFAPVLVV
ncbi:MAG: hypothetical protein HQL43_02750 [Alphaproteobacteria bacterium]|nr:hypothetical protein [Alphaproteobacteria bacterium]